MAQLRESEASLERQLEAGFDGDIGKPLNLKEFLDTVRATVERKTT